MKYTMNELKIANEHLKSVCNDYERDFNAQITKLNNKENTLVELLKKLDLKKLEIARANGNEDASDEDLVEVNAGGKLIAVKRRILTQLKGTRLEALFSGRWDKRLQKDIHGRIFLDVNPLCFQAIVGYLAEKAISSAEKPPELPSVDQEHKHIFRRQLELFGLLEKMVVLPDSKIIKDDDQVTQLHDWLDEDGSGGKFSLVYRFTRDGRSGKNFHSKSDGHRHTLTIIESTDGFLLGGYSNTAWASNCGKQNGGYGSYHCNQQYNYPKPANKAFLFVLSGSGVLSPCKMKLRNANDTIAIFNHYDKSPGSSGKSNRIGWGNDMIITFEDYNHTPTVYLEAGQNYEAGSSTQLSFGNTYTIKEMEVFQVIPGAPNASHQKKKATFNSPQLNQVHGFSEEVNNAINGKWESLKDAENEIRCLEESFKNEESFMSIFARGEPQDVLTLNVCGTIMATRRQTLQLCKGSVLASEFSMESMANRGSEETVEDWDHEDVVAWLNQIDGIPDSAVREFEENQVTGQELLALGAEGLKDFGVARKASIYLLLDKIKKLEKEGRESVHLIEHSPYCFEKILDHLRLEGPFMKGLVKTKHRLPYVRSSEKARYEKVLRQLFPGDSSKIFRD